MFNYVDPAQDTQAEVKCYYYKAQNSGHFLILQTRISVKNIPCVGQMLGIQ